MLSRYIGNKSELLDDIGAAVGSHVSPGALVCDIFSGTLAVSLDLKRRGYRVIANDANLFSAAYGRAFLTNSEIPAFTIEELLPSRARQSALERAACAVEGLAKLPGYCFLQKTAPRRRFTRLTAVLEFLMTASESSVPVSYRRTDFYDAYTEAGRRSKFVSLRGSKGRRRFFSADNGHRIDVVLGYIRWWRRSGRLQDPAYSTLVCCLMNAVERVSNTQGTYHDFPRDDIDPRALKPLRLVPPAYDGILGQPVGPLLGVAEDSLQFIKRVPPHDLLYIDPPYNFRQYTSYYFLMNLLAKYAEIDDLDDYFGALQYVRGQNMRDDFTSTFCKPDLFIPSLTELIMSAKANWVVLSYFSGRNHWNDFKADDNDIGHGKLRALFESSLFTRGSLTAIPVSRLNYQSYGGYRARVVDEYLFVGRKAK